jgi:NADPH2:quinone reductase
MRDLGATQTIDYSARDLGDAIHQLHPAGIAALVDLVNQRDALTDLGSVVRSGGRLATVLGAADIEHLASRGVTAANVNAMPTAEKLRYLGDLASSGELAVVIQGVYPLDQVPEALVAFQQGKRGKLVLTVAAPGG